MASFTYGSSSNVTLQLMFNKTVVHTQFDLFIIYHIEQQKQLSSVECFTVNMFLSDIPQKPLMDLLNTESFLSI